LSDSTDRSAEGGKVVVFGNGQMAEIAHWYLTSDSPFDVVGFCVDTDYITDDKYKGQPVVPFESVADHYPPDDHLLFIPISAKEVNRLRATKYEAAKGMGYRFASYVSTRAMVAPGVPIGDNCFILENNVVQPFASIGNDCILWSGNHIGHHSTVMDHCFLASHVVISGRVRVHPYCYFGVNSTVRDGIEIGEGCVVGAGALIMRSAKKGSVYAQAHTRRAPFAAESARIV
jgi:sugar O-acyltransferase (sialic acid O-acetyltransferase NeuD family)